ncbi:MAG: gamma-glutamylcyclotransferase [Magnetospirillum sp.]|nr:gamma-glutamylcyclotransferase [Magnetospirillum sp.]
MRLFFFGTLMDPEVREIVMGRALPADAIETGVAQGFRRVFVAGRHYPMLLPHASGWVEGTLVSGLDAETVHRLQVYEGWEYALHPIQVRTGSGQTVMAHVFLCPPHIEPDRREWRLDQWQLRHKRPFLRKARALMERASRGSLPAATGQRPRPALAPRTIGKK